MPEKGGTLAIFMYWMNSGNIFIADRLSAIKATNRAVWSGRVCVYIYIFIYLFIYLYIYIYIRHTSNCMGAVSVVSSPDY